MRREDYHAAGRDFVQLLDEHGPFGLERFHDIEVMDDRATHVDGRPMLVQGVADCVDRSPNTSAKAARRCQEYANLGPQGWRRVVDRSGNDRKIGHRFQQHRPPPSLVRSGARQIYLS